MNIKNIVVVSPMHKELQRLITAKKLQKNFRFLPEEHFTEQDLQWADTLVAFNMKATYNFSHLQWVHSLGAGVDKFLFKKKWNENVLLTRTICSFGQRIAEYCLSYILKDLQYHDQFHAFKKEKKWQPMTPKLLSEQKVMIYGTGEIGQKTAKIFSLLGVDVYGVSLSGKQKEVFTEVIAVDNHLSRVSEMDYFINTLPLTEKTEGLFNEDFFNNVSNSGFINVGRGASLNEAALLEALDQEQIRFAILDVFSEEPLPRNNKLWEHPNVWITPHISAVTTPVEAVNCFIETLKNLEEGLPLSNKVDITKGF
ncbi:D-2-hydroxyacid dehydrogenase [Anaerobacillus sp. CMMVII]|uniref:D-2-hydroxyacid dehydrogenase n=1 Tax=Anaerobacillus sp. CMMVII TaxID=2755588 RepID=UPI0021B77BB8|nr:D-2-hydroxyacid dehydrogenase [Anaerobacillus sp. CMMVII]MCT8138044.1 D-2-hydroxyacid dehydrogenase [Anaerobacillus sp. CMMVII]